MQCHRTPELLLADAFIGGGAQQQVWVHVCVCKRCCAFYQLLAGCGCIPQSVTDCSSP